MLSCSCEHIPSRTCVEIKFDRLFTTRAGKVIDMHDHKGAISETGKALPLGAKRRHAVKHDG
jgi:hypothetical protein